jgi:hypothetical protein
MLVSYGVKYKFLIRRSNVMKKGFLIVLSSILAIVFTVTIPVDAGNANKKDEGEQKRKYKQDHEKSKVHKEKGSKQRKHCVELEGEARIKYEEMMRERRNKSKEVKREDESKGDIKGEEGRAKAFEKATDKGKGEKKGRPGWNFWGRDKESGK